MREDRPPAHPRTCESAEDASRVLKRQAAVQFGYVLFFAAFVLAPSLSASPSLIMVAATALAAVWLVGCLARFSGLPRADELLLSGCASPVLVGLLHLVYRTNFVWSHGGLTDPSVPGSSALAFGLAWAMEMFTVFLPGLWFLRQNIRSLAPAPIQPLSRPASRKRRT